MPLRGVIKAQTKGVASVFVHRLRQGDLIKLGGSALAGLRPAFPAKGSLGPPPPPPVVPGSQTYSTPGTYLIDLPLFNTLVVTLWGPGGGGGNLEYGDGAAGGVSSFDVMIANSGGGGGCFGNSSPSGSGGTASGGDINITGSSGAGGVYGGGAGGASPNGGVGNGASPGSGGHASHSGAWAGGGGGGGGYSRKTYSFGQISGTVAIIVGGGGLWQADGYGGQNGADGKAILSWN